MTASCKGVVVKDHIPDPDRIIVMQLQVGWLFYTIQIWHWDLQVLHDRHCYSKKSARLGKLLDMILEYYIYLKQNRM